MALRPGLAPLAALLLAGCTLNPAASSPVVPTGTAATLPSPGRTLSPTAAPTPTATPEPTPEPTEAIALAKLVGQKLMIALDGPTAGATLLGRIRRGEVGGVVLFGRNVTSEAQVTALIASLQAAAKDGGQPPLVVSIDQEGGSIMRFPWAPPTLSPPQLGHLGSTSEARHQGEITAAALLADGVNMDLAPVADVPVSTSSFMYLQGRWWSFDAAKTARLSSAFADGLRSGGVVPTMKHFPGLGWATRTTDRYVVTIDASLGEIEEDLAPYRTAIAAGLPVVMLSNATYPVFDPGHAAGWSPQVNAYLRGDLGFTGMTITDSLNGIAKAMGASATELGILASIAGTDMLMFTGSESASAAAYARILDAAKSGRIPRDLLEASYARILALKASLGG